MTSKPFKPSPEPEALLAGFERAGYVPVAPAILQPAEPFLDLSGEDIRRRMFLTSDPQGRELCLRPDITIPVCRDYLASETVGRPQGYCYLGPVFRHREVGPSEFLQGGVESFGRPDAAAADAEMLSLALDAVKQYGLAMPVIRLGDVALFSALVAALDLAPAWKRRLIKDFNHKSSLTHDLDRLTARSANSHPEHQGVLTALAGSNPAQARALVADLLSIAGISAVGGRSIGEIADRFLEQSTLGAKLPPETRTLIEKFLAIGGDPAWAAAELRTFAHEAGIAFDSALDRLEGRIDRLAARGIDIAHIAFSTAFGRGLDYYTGMVFELHDPVGGAGPLAAGGRYDDLLSRLGSPRAIPAVGFSVWIDRLAALRSGA